MGSKFVTDRQTNTLTPYAGVCGFFLPVKFATSLLASLAGGLTKNGSRTFYINNNINGSFFFKWQFRKEHLGIAGHRGPVV